MRLITPSSRQPGELNRYEHLLMGDLGRAIEKLGNRIVRPPVLYIEVAPTGGGVAVYAKTKRGRVQIGHYPASFTAHIGLGKGIQSHEG